MGKKSNIVARKAVFVADAHLCADDATSRAFVALAEKALADGAALFLLGDIFDLFFGDARFAFSWQKPILDRLTELRRRGLFIVYVEGNRDFHIRAGYEGTAFDQVAEGELTANVGGRRIAMAHGDSVNADDLWYRFWKTASKNPLSFAIFRALPSRVALALAERLERTLKETNHRFRGQVPMETVREYGRRKVAEGNDFVVLGHFHAEADETIDVDGRKGRVVLVPSFKDGRRYLEVDETGAARFATFEVSAP